MLCYYCISSEVMTLFQSEWWLGTGGEMTRFIIYYTFHLPGFLLMVHPSFSFLSTPLSSIVVVLYDKGYRDMLTCYIAHQFMS